MTDTEIKVGSFGPLTGPAALWGNIMKGMDAHFKMINEQGGIHGRKINFIMKDDAYDPSRTVPLLENLFNEMRYSHLSEESGLLRCMSVKDYLVEENIPWVAPTSGATNWSIPMSPNIFSVLPYYIDEGYIQARFAVEELKAKRSALSTRMMMSERVLLLELRTIFKKMNRIRCRGSCRGYGYRFEFAHCSSSGIGSGRSPIMDTTKTGCDHRN